MKSIQTKIIILVLTGIIISTLIIGGTGIISFGKAIDNDSVKVINLICSEQANELNNVLGRIEQSVEVLSGYACDNLKSVESLSEDIDYREEYTRELEELGQTIADATDGSVAIYARFNPDITEPKAGFFRVKNSETGEYEQTELTDFTKYSPDDVEHVGWYYLPVSEGKAVWLSPYYNRNIDIYMISYVIPVYMDNELFGIVGMDIDFQYITQKVDEILLYDTGHAYITDSDFEVVYGDETEDDKSQSAYRTLENGMNLVVTVPVSEINYTKNTLIVRIIIMILLILTVFIIAAMLIAKTIVRPLRELNVAAKEIAAGNLDVSLACRSKDEVGTLSESLKETAGQLKVRIDYINNLAYMDKLTEIKNNTAYLYEVSSVNERMNGQKISFAIFVIDVNGLKTVNDTRGHDYGNKLIIAVAKAAVGVFGEDKTYRIGGDEFAVILEDADNNICDRLEAEFQESLKSNPEGMQVSAAIGYAIYDKTTDSTFENVFKRADSNMYNNKLAMKAGRLN